MELNSNLDVKKGSNTTRLINDPTDWLVGGWAAGAGIEYGFDKWSLGAEYLYVDRQVDTTNTAGSTKTNSDVTYGMNIVRATAKMRF